MDDYGQPIVLTRRNGRALVGRPVPRTALAAEIWLAVVALAMTLVCVPAALLPAVPLLGRE